MGGSIITGVGQRVGRRCDRNNIGIRPGIHKRHGIEIRLIVWIVRALDLGSLDSLRRKEEEAAEERQSQKV